MVEHVKELAAELQSDVLYDGDVLVDGEIPLLKIRCAKRVASQVAEGSVGRGNGESAAGEISQQHLCRRLAGGAGAGDIGALNGRASIFGIGRQSRNIVDRCRRI